MGLTEEIAAKAKEIHSDGYPMSLGEIANLYKDGELILHPEFQREFRWTSKQKSNLIESILLGIPLPSIFVVQEANGVWNVIDGLQRLSTIFEFMGVLKDENDIPVPPSKLLKTKFLPSLENKVWEDKENGDGPNTLTQSQRIDFKRAKIQVTIITKTSDPDAKFELFQRLNTGGSSLTDQEVRNCLMIMNNEDFYYFIKRLSNNKDFKETLSLSDRQLEEKYDMELICRYLAGKYASKDEFRNLSDISEFVNDKMISLAKDSTFDMEKEGNEFEKLFLLLNGLGVNHPFAKYNTEKNIFSGMFLISTFEVIAIGLGKLINNYSENDSNLILEKIKGLWEDNDFLRASGSGQSAKTRMPICISIGEYLFSKK